MNDKDISDTISVNTIKAFIQNKPFLPKGRAFWFVWNTAGNYWDATDTITLSKGVVTLSKREHISIEKQTCRTISHEVMHRIIYNQLNIKASCQFDNIAKSLKEFGVW